MKGLLGRKLGMTQVFTTDGTLIPVSVVEVLPNVVLQKKTLETDNYEAVQLGVVDVKEHRANKSEIAHAAKANTAPKHFVREIAGSELLSYEVGDEIKADLFSAGEFVDVTGTSRGKGYQGAIRRNNQAIGPKAHGSGFHRGVGSLATGGRNNGYINKGRIMAGHEGARTRTNQNLEIIKVDTENNYILVKGNVPGPRRGYVVVKTTTKHVKSTSPVELIDYSAKEDSENA
ncbi:50S ribosomal protein L3 [Erysipelothrix larvae]|uniref:Large ribosomal subunit protein uL3 n=1 Tax=Erysipelothrix larvae TaxID=1514105 RepID=A0A0X8H059_9FIRM|nr:50S ribosomal protein L3 [Erysipelothrix larvae]AMC93590.1 50S ribosomal protein L3 [Erysipelothrix larvae]